MAGPLAAVEALHGAGKDLEHELEVDGLIDDGEGAGAERGFHFAGVVARGAVAPDDEGRRGALEAREEFEDAGAAFLDGVLCAGGGVEGEAEVHDSEVDGLGLEESCGVLRGRGADAVDTHGRQEGGEPVGPGLVLPAAVGQEEVEPGLGGG